MDNLFTCARVPGIKCATNQKVNPLTLLQNFCRATARIHLCLGQRHLLLQQSECGPHLRRRWIDKNCHLQKLQKLKPNTKSCRIDCVTRVGQQEEMWSEGLCVATVSFTSLQLFPTFLFLRFFSATVQDFSRPLFKTFFSA